MDRGHPLWPPTVLAFFPQDWKVRSHSPGGGGVLPGAGRQERDVRLKEEQGLDGKMTAAQGWAGERRVRS